MTLDEIIEQYSGKLIKVTIKDNISAIGKISGYETKTESNTNEDIISLKVNETLCYEIDVPDIIKIEEITQ